MASTKGDNADSKEEIVTETTIVGVTESGVIRKRSVKRRISRDDSHLKERKPYGNDKEEYVKLMERVLGERAAASALEVLQERWRMIMYMYEDCMELVKQWDEQRLLKQHQRRKRRMLFLSFVSIPFLLLFVIWLVARWW